MIDGIRENGSEAAEFVIRKVIMWSYTGRLITLLFSCLENVVETKP